MTEKPNQSVRHLLLLSFRQGITAEQIHQSMDKFRALILIIPGIIGFEHGPYDSPEGLNRGFTYACLLTFENSQARDAYLPHPAHQEFGKNVLLPIIQELLVFDYAIQS